MIKGVWLVSRRDQYQHNKMSGNNKEALMEGGDKWVTPPYHTKGIQGMVVLIGENIYHD